MATAAATERAAPTRKVQGSKRISTRRARRDGDPAEESVDAEDGRFDPVHFSAPARVPGVGDHEDGRMLWRNIEAQQLGPLGDPLDGRDLGWAVEAGSLAFHDG